MMAQAGEAASSRAAPHRAASAPYTRRVTTPETWRLFFALDPSPALRRRLDAQRALWREDDHTRFGAASRLHLTLVFMPRVEPAAVARLLDAGAAVARSAQACVLRLDHAEVWPDNGIAHLAPSVVPPALRALREALLDAVLAAGVTADRRPWRPHVTLARNALGAKPPAAGFAAEDWRVRGFSLLRSRAADGPYGELGRWRLGTR